MPFYLTPTLILKRNTTANKDEIFKLFHSCKAGFVTKVPLENLSALLNDRDIFIKFNTRV